jgi:hypothetical protein
MPKENEKPAIGELQQYIGTKLLKATPLTLGEYNKYRGWEMPKDENPDREGFLVVYSDGYESWSPEEVFTEAYAEIPEGKDADRVLEHVRARTDELLEA